MSRYTQQPDPLELPEPSSFRDLEERWSLLPGPVRLALFEISVSADAQDACWADVRRQADVQIESELLIDCQLEALLRAVPNDELGRAERVMYLAAATTGMRQGELVALRWRDVDWSARRIRVRRSYVRGEFGTPKSKRSSRAVPLIDRVAGELDQLAKATAFGGDDDLVFPHPATGGPLDRSKILKRFKAAMKAAGLGDRLGDGGITFHSLRHSFGTAMAAQGVPMRLLQELLGHRDCATTLIYAHYSPSAHEVEWAEKAFAADERFSAPPRRLGVAAAP